MAEQERDRVTIAVYAPARAFASGVQTALVRLGYNLLTAKTAERHASSEDEALRPLLRIVDDRELESVPLDAGTRPLPMILLTGRGADAPTDARAVGTIQRRARLGPLYELLQNALEEVPRAVPRVDAAIPARCTRGQRQWVGAIHSISERGCLIETQQQLERDLRVDVTFPLASHGLIQVAAQPSYADGERTGLIFRGAGETAREAIASYVTDRLGS